MKYIIIQDLEAQRRAIGYTDTQEEADALLERIRTERKVLFDTLRDTLKEYDVKQFEIPCMESSIKDVRRIVENNPDDILTPVLTRQLKAYDKTGLTRDNIYAKMREQMGVELLPEAIILPYWEKLEDGWFEFEIEPLNYGLYNGDVNDI